MEMPSVVKKAYDLDKSLRYDEVKQLVEWTAKQRHLPEITELQAILFLQSCYYHTEPAKRAIDSYFTARTLAPDMFDGTIVDGATETSRDITFATMLPTQTPQGHCVFIGKLLDTNPERMFFYAQVKLFDMIVLHHLHESGPCKGLEIILDTEGATLRHLPRLGLATIRRTLHYVQEAMPIRLKAVHIINVVPLVEKVFVIGKPFMKKELLDLIQFHTKDMKDFYKSVPKEMLPKEYGGKAPAIREIQAGVNRELASNGDFFKVLQSQQVDESKREGAANNASQLFGTEGSFKRLEVD